MGGRLDFRILGPLEARLDGQALNLGGARQRGVLALLLLHANEVLSSDRLIDELWAEDPPGDAGAALQAHVSRLRKLLEPEHGGEPRVIVTSQPGYVIRADADTLDLLRFEALVAEGRRRLEDGAASGAAEVLREALGLWRGRPLADLEAEAFAQEPIRELDELWLEAVELRIDGDLENGRGADLVRELSALVRSHPLRERLRMQLMLALYRSDRQVEALEAFADLRRTLADEQGLEPSRELRALQEAILRQDPALDLVRPARSRPRRRRRWIGAVAAVAAAAAVAGVVSLSGSGDEPGSPPSTGVLAIVSPRSGEVQARVPVGSMPSAVAVGYGRAWVLNADDQTLSRIELRSRAVDTFAIGSTPTDVAVGSGAVWVGSGGHVPGTQDSGLVATELERLDVDTRAARATVVLPRTPGIVSNLVSDHVAVGAGGVWVIGPDGRVLRIDPRTNRIAATIAGVRARAVATDAEYVWALADDGTVTRIDSRSNAVVGSGRVDASSVASIAAGSGGAWVSAPADGALWRADPGAGDRLVMRTIPVAPGTTDLAYGAGALWAVNPLRGTLAQVAKRHVVRTISVGGFPRALTVAGGKVFVASAPATSAARPASTAAAGIRPLPSAVCERPFYGGTQPAQRLVVSDLPLQGDLRASSQQMVAAMAFVLRQRGFRAGRWRVAYQSCDDAVAATGLPDTGKCTANARMYGRAPDVIAVAGPLNSDCAVAAIPELGRARPPLALVSPLSSYAGLTRVAAGAPPGELRSLYPGGRRNFLRVIPTDGLQIAAQALLAKRLGRAPVYVLDDGDVGYGRVAAAQFERSANALGLPLAGRASWNPGARSHAGLAARVAAARPGAVFLGGRLDTGGATVVRALRARLGARVAILAPDGFAPTSLLRRQAGAAATGMFVAISGIVGAGELGPEGRRFARSFGATLAGEQLEPSAIYAAQAMEVVLDAVARSDGTRGSVLKALFETRIPRGLIGDVAFDRNGDVAASPITILRVEPGARAIAVFEDAVVDRVLRVPIDLLR